MRQISTEGIILKKRNFGEHDQFITIFSPILGKIDAKAKGARKINSSFTGHLELLNICKLQIYNKNQNYTITQCQSIKTFKDIRNDLNKTIMSQLILEIFQKTTPSEGNGQELFELLEDTLDALGKTKKTTLCIESFKIKLLNLLGILPEIARCSKCHKKWDESDKILLEASGQILCTECSSKSKNPVKLPFKLVKLINYICRENIKKTHKILLKQEEAVILKAFGDKFLENYLSNEINTERIISKFITQL